MKSDDTTFGALARAIYLFKKKFNLTQPLIRNSILKIIVKSET